MFLLCVVLLVSALAIGGSEETNDKSPFKSKAGITRSGVQKMKQSFKMKEKMKFSCWFFTPPLDINKENVSFVLSPTHL